MNRTNKMVFTLSLILPTSVIFAAQPLWSIAGAQMGADDDAVPPALTAQFIPTAPAGKDVSIRWVERDSLGVAVDREDRSVNLKQVRGGELHRVQAESGQGAAQPIVPRTWQVRPSRFPRHAVPGMHEQRQEMVTERFEFLCIQKLENGRYRTALEYLGTDGNKRGHVFEGTREELRRQIGQSRELPAAARRHLLHALNMNDGRPMPRFRRPLDYEELMRTWREGGWMQY